MTQRFGHPRFAAVAAVTMLALVLGVTLVSVRPITAAELPRAGITTTAGPHPAPVGQEGGGKLTREDWFKRAPVVIGAIVIVVSLDTFVIVRIVRKRRMDAARMRAPGPR